MNTFRINHLGRLGAPCALALVLAGTALAETPAPADTAAEDAYLDILPAIDIPEDVQPIPGSVNEEFRNCQAVWPAEYDESQKGPEARAYRDIYGFIKARNVIESQDCTCVGKVANWADVEALADYLRSTNNVAELAWKHTKDVFDSSNELFPVAETMCGGAF